MKFYLSILLVTAVAFCAQAEGPEFKFANFQIIKAQLGLAPYFSQNPARQLRVAIFADSFQGYEAKIGTSLPQSTYFHEGPLKTEGLAPILGTHGTYMAELMTALMTDQGRALQFAPELHLYNATGIDNFRSAIDDAITRKIDIIVYQEVWEFGGNFDGAGFINREVTRATNAGIIWINSAGNSGKTTFNSSIRRGSKDDWVSLPDPNDSLAIRCEKITEPAKKCAIRVVLSWNDFKDDITKGTDKNLDLQLTDDFLGVIETSELRQVKVINESHPSKDTSIYPREIIETEVVPGLYYIRVKDRSHNFTSSDRLRIEVTGKAVTAEHQEANSGSEVISMSHFDPQENLYNPADNPSVVTVGANDSDRSSISKKLGKPEVTCPSSVVLGDGAEYRGSSNSTAFVAARFAILKTLNPEIKQSELIRTTNIQLHKTISVENQTLNHLAQSTPLQRPSTQDLGFTGFGPGGCFKSAGWNAHTAPYLQAAIDRGGVIVNTLAGFKIAVNFDPALLVGRSSQQRQASSDAILGTPNGFKIVSRQEAADRQPSDVEIFQIPIDIGFCHN